VNRGPEHEYLGKVTGTVTSGVANSSGATVQPSVEEFLVKVVPWPVNGAGHVNLHYSMLTCVIQAGALCAVPVEEHCWSRPTDSPHRIYADGDTGRDFPLRTVATN
jgi:hypothetical protein